MQDGTLTKHGGTARNVYLWKLFIIEAREEWYEMFTRGRHVLYRYSLLDQFSRTHIKASGLAKHEMRDGRGRKSWNNTIQMHVQGHVASKTKAQNAIY